MKIIWVQNWIISIRTILQVQTQLLVIIGKIWRICTNINNSRTVLLILHNFHKTKWERTIANNAADFTVVHVIQLFLRSIEYIWFQIISIRRIQRIFIEILWWNKAKINKTVDNAKKKQLIEGHFIRYRWSDSQYNDKDRVSNQLKINKI